MARLPALPSLEIIQGFKKIIDFAVWKGLPYARAWPRFRRAKLTTASIAAATLFGQIIKSYALLAALAHAFFNEDAKDQPRTPRDIFVSAVYGHLHEASMSDFLTLLQESRDFLEDLTALLNALDSVGADELDVNVEDSVLPDGAATAAHQVTQNASLATIASIADALQSIDTDALQIRGRDQLFSFKDRYKQTLSHTKVAAGNKNLVFSIVPGGELWVVTTVCAVNTSGVTTYTSVAQYDAITTCTLKRQVPAAAQEAVVWSGHAFMLNPDRIFVAFNGCADGDVLLATAVGYKMTLET